MVLLDGETVATTKNPTCFTAGIGKTPGSRPRKSPQGQVVPAYDCTLSGKNENLSRFCSRLKGRSRRLEREWPGLDLGFFVVGLGCHSHGIQTPLALVRTTSSDV